ncbi:WxL protein peptidoglycan domain-containing protein [Vagococcus salmoninarum]|uniref:DUF916 domain-containing protein n=1 Tax=Vagococcus salmoninarum TaxID=2739 RepID=UPI003F97AB25
MKKIFKVIGVYLLVINQSLATLAVAQDNGGIGFTYHNEIPENQIAAGNFFDLLVEPGAEQTLVTRIHNYENYDMMIKISINDSKTSASGLLEYGESSLQNTSELKYSLVDYLTGPKEVLVKAQTSEVINFHLKMPGETFDGLLLGGVQLQEVGREPAEVTGFAVENEYAFVFSVSLRQNHKEVPLKLNSSPTTYQHDNDQSVVTLAITNDSRLIGKELKLRTTLYEAGTEEPLAESQLTDFKLAPMSIFNYSMPTNKLVPGEYLTKTTINSAGQEWLLEEVFTVKAEVGGGTEPQLIRRKRSKILLPLLLVASCLLVSTAILYFVLIKAKNS